MRQAAPQLTVRQIRKTEDYDKFPVAALQALAQIRHRLDEIEPKAIEKAREQGFTWEDLAEVMGVSRQAVYQKYRHHLARSRRTGRDGA